MGFRVFIWQDRESMLDANSVETLLYRDFKSIDDATALIVSLISAGFPCAIDGGQEVSGEK